MAEPVVSFVVEELGRWLIEKAKFLHGVSDKVEHAKEELEYLRYFLQDADAKASMEESATLRNLVAQIRETAYDLEDVIATYASKVESKRTTEANFVKLIKRYVCNLTEIFEMNKFGSEIEKYSVRISELRSKLSSYGIVDTTSTSRVSSPRLPATYRHFPDEHFVRYKEDIDKVVASLSVMEEKPHRIISICGMGGIGKTTLAKKVYNDSRVRRHFDCFAWAYVSQQCNVRDVWKEILNKFASHIKEESSNDEIAERLYKVQEERKCLVILDDVWTTEMWDSLKAAFPQATSTADTSSKIIITTRNKKLLRRADRNGFQYEPPCLDEPQSWELLEKIVFSGMDDTQTSNIDQQRIKDLGKKMLKHCDGLPLAIIVLGGLLCAKHRVDEWEVLHKNIEKQMMMDGGDLSRILGLSYNDLPYYLKPCFLHLAHYPEDYEINVKELCMIWVAEGIIIVSNQLTQQNSNNLLDMMEETAYNYLTQLVERCMVQVVKHGSIIGRIKTIRMHDVMRDLCLLKAKQVNFVHLLSTSSSSFDQWGHKQEEAVNSNLSCSSGMESKVRRLAIHHFYSYDNVHQIVQKHSKHLRSLMVFDCKQTSLEKTKVSNMLKIGCDLLKVLSYFDSAYLPIETGQLIHLRFLRIRRRKQSGLLNPVVLFPSTTTGALRSLYVLKIDTLYEGQRVNISNVIWMLEQLRHLYLPRRYEVEGGRLKLKNLGNFKTLVNINLQDLCSYYNNNGELTNLVKLDVVVHKEIQNDEQIVQRISLDHHLRSLSWKMASKYGYVKLPAISKYNPDIYKLKLEVQTKKSVREIQFPSKLVKLILKKTSYTEDPMPTLGKLQNLRTLTLDDDALSRDVEEIVCCKDGFPKLEYLHLSELSFLNQWKVEEGALCSLRRLIIDQCHQLRKIPDGLRRIHSLKEIVKEGRRGL